MKKRLSVAVKHTIQFLSFLFLVYTFCACGGDDPEIIPDTPDTPAEEQTDDDMPFYCGLWYWNGNDDAIAIKPDGSLLYYESYGKTNQDVTAGRYAYDAQTQVFTMMLYDLGGVRPYRAYSYIVKSKTDNLLNIRRLEDNTDVSLTRLSKAEGTYTASSMTVPEQMLGLWLISEAGDAVKVEKAGVLTYYEHYGDADRQDVVSGRYTYDTKARILTAIIPNGEYGYKKNQNEYETMLYYVDGYSESQINLYDLNEDEAELLLKIN